MDRIGSKRRFSFLAVALFAAAFLLLSGPAEAQTVRVTGFVKSPVAEGAQVQLLPIESMYERAVRELTGGAPPEPLARVAVAADGWYRLEAPDPGMWRVRVEAPDRVAEELRVTPLLEDLTLPPVELELANELEVVVRNKDGVPVAGALVGVHHERRWMFGTWVPADRRTQADSNSVVRLPVADDERLTLAAFAPGFGISEEKDAGAGEVTLVVPNQARHVTAVVKDENGRSSGGVAVLAGDRSWALGLTSKTGAVEFSVSGDRPRIALLGPEGASLSHGLSPRELSEGLLELELPTPTTISGRVIDRQNRQPLAGAFVWSSLFPERAIKTDSVGAYTLRISRHSRDNVFAVARGYFLESAEIANMQGAKGRGPTLALRPGARIRGRVVDGDGAPVAGTSVQATPKQSDHRIIRRVNAMSGPPRADTLADGVFELGPLDPADAYTVTAQKEGSAPSTAEVTGLEPFATLSGVEIVLRTGASGTGRVSDEDGGPVVGAEISLTESRSPRNMAFIRFGSGEAFERTTTSGTDGRYRFDHLPKEDFDLTVEAVGFAPNRVPGLSVEGEGTDWGEVVLTAGVAIEGRVSDTGGRPLEGVSIQASEANQMAGRIFMFRDDSGEAPDATTAADGFFRIVDRKRGEKVDLTFQKTGWVLETLSAVEAPSAEPIAVALRPASTLSGRILDPSGAGIATARILASKEGGGASSGGRALMMSIIGFSASDSDGFFELEGLEAGTIRLQVSAASWRTAELGGVEIPRGQDVTDLEVILQPGATVSGRVNLADGTPVTGAYVSVKEQGARPFSAGSGQTDGDGRYRLDGIEPGRRLIAATEETLGEVAEEIEVSEGENKLDLVYSGGTSVEGRVVDHLGGPVAGAEVSLRQPGQFWGRGHAASDESGSFRFDGVRDGLYTLYAEREGHGPKTLEDPVEVTGQPLAGLEIALAAAGVITGQLVGLEPDELSEVEIWARKQEPGYVRGRPAFNGSYRVTDLHPGDWRVSAHSSRTGRRAEGRVTVDPGGVEAVLDLEFGVGLTLTGSILVDNEPLTAVSLRVSGTDVSSRGSATTNHKGRFSIQGLQPGNYDLSIMSRETGLHHSQKLELETDRDVLIELETARVAGFVLAADSREPVDGAAVALKPVDPLADEARHFLNRGSGTDSRGGFTVHDVIPGTYKAVASKEGYATAEKVFSVAGGEFVDDLELVLSPTEGLAVRVLMPSGSPASALNAVVLDNAGNSRVTGRYTADSKGRVRFSTVPAGSWLVILSVPGAAVAEVQALVPDSELTVQLAREAKLEVEVPELLESSGLATAELFGPDGLSFRNLAWGGRIRHEFRFSGGRLSVSGLPARPWRLEIRSPDGRSWSKKLVTRSGQTTNTVVD